MKEGLELQDIALLGRTFAEYSEYFSLRDLDLSREKVLDIGAGVSSFCAEASERGYDVTGADPIYAAAPEIALKCGVSLLSPCVLRLRRKAGGRNWERAHAEAEPRSAYLLSGPARDVWEHSIPPVVALRYSITFRNLRGG